MSNMPSRDIGRFKRLWEALRTGVNPFRAGTTADANGAGGGAVVPSKPSFNADISVNETAQNFYNGHLQVRDESLEKSIEEIEAKGVPVVDTVNLSQEEIDIQVKWDKEHPTQEEQERNQNKESIKMSTSPVAVNATDNAPSTVQQQPTLDDRILAASKAGAFVAEMFAPQAAAAIEAGVNAEPIILGLFHMFSAVFAHHVKNVAPTAVK